MQKFIRRNKSFVNLPTHDSFGKVQVVATRVSCGFDCLNQSYFGLSEQQQGYEVTVLLEYMSSN